MTYNAPCAYEIAESFRAERGKTVILGGYHPSLMPEESIQHADSVCIGDAEANLPQMLNDFAGGHIKPFYRSDLIHLGGLPRPRRDLLRAQDHAPLDAIQATRGCGRRCSFCSVAAFHRSRLCVGPAAEVIDELRSPGSSILFMDDSLTGNHEYAKELLATIIPLRKTWFSQAGIDIAEDDELLRLASRSDCRGLFIGFESLAEAGLRRWRKQTNIGKDYRAAVRRLHQAGIDVYAGFVFGGDDDTPDVFPRTLEFLAETNVESLQATRMTPFPGMPLFEEMERDGRITDCSWSHNDSGHVVYEPAHMSRETLSNGVSWVQREFFGRRSIARRTWRSLGYLDPRIVAQAVLPLNVGYRAKMAAEGTLRRADFECAQ